MPKRIFVSYRRDDGRDMAARIRDRLVKSFGSDGVFMDVSNLVPGQNFHDELTTALDETDVMVAVIGPDWLSIYASRKTTGRHDYAAAEIAGALQRGLTIIPVLLDKAELPAHSDLGEDIADFVNRQAMRVTFTEFDLMVPALPDAIRRARGSRAAREPAVRRSRRWVPVAATFAVLATAAAPLAALAVLHPEWVSVPRPIQQLFRADPARQARAAAEAERKRLGDLADAAGLKLRSGQAASDPHPNVGIWLFNIQWDDCRNGPKAGFRVSVGADDRLTAIPSADLTRQAREGNGITDAAGAMTFSYKVCQGVCWENRLTGALNEGAGAGRAVSFQETKVLCSGVFTARKE